ncbi:DUF6293 family protein [Halobium palmae]|uniref:DUF6293 family protein n=1 Tax=Halobium palmae TaxID=1776492 RepID=A0ABD5RVI3_9EURY
MTHKTHIIPVGFDFERLIFPISKGNFDANKVILINQDNEEETQASELSGRMTDELSASFELFGVEVEKEIIESETLYNYEELYPWAYREIRNEAMHQGEVFINISSMPRTVAFAFATAANTLISEFPELRDQVHTYYVSPDEYRVLELIEEIEDEIEFLRTLARDGDLRIHERIQKMSQLLESIDRRGVTKGANKPVEFPASPSGDLSNFEKEILYFLRREGTLPSTSKLAEELARDRNEEYGESYRSRVQYNVKQLDKKGYVNRRKEGNSHETSLSVIGTMWVETHPEPNTKPSF